MKGQNFQKKKIRGNFQTKIRGNFHKKIRENFQKKNQPLDDFKSNYTCLIKSFEDSNLTLFELKSERLRSNLIVKVMINGTWLWGMVSFRFWFWISAWNKDALEARSGLGATMETKLFYSFLFYTSIEIEIFFPTTFYYWQIFTKKEKKYWPLNVAEKSFLERTDFLSLSWFFPPECFSSIEVWIKLKWCHFTHNI